MNLDAALAAIDAAHTQKEVLGVLRAFAEGSLPASKVWSSLDDEDADGVAHIALELARLRLSTMSSEPELVAMETAFARACVKNAELLDATGAWMAYQARAHTSEGASPPEL